MAKDHGGDIHLLLLVHLNGNTTAIVPHTDQVVLPAECARTHYTYTVIKMCTLGELSGARVMSQSQQVNLCFLSLQWK